MYLKINISDICLIPFDHLTYTNHLSTNIDILGKFPRKPVSSFILHTAKLSQICNNTEPFQINTMK